MILLSPQRLLAVPWWRKGMLLAIRHRNMPEPHPISLSNEIATRDFEAFFNRYEPEIAGYLWRMTGDEQGACDLCQETFLRAWQHFDTICTYEKPGAWLIKVATNLALQYLRKQATPIRAATPLDNILEPSSSDHGKRVVENDLIRETLLELSPRARALLVLREVHGLTGDEIAQTLGMPSTAVKMALWRACTQFREAYTRKGGQA
jgi:RNA polymerase sigma-70 factor, ECF subfamily